MSIGIVSRRVQPANIPDLVQTEGQQTLASVYMGWMCRGDAGTHKK